MPLEDRCVGVQRGARRANFDLVGVRRPRVAEVVNDRAHERGEPLDGCEPLEEAEAAKEEVHREENIGGRLSISRSDFHAHPPSILPTTHCEPGGNVSKYDSTSLATMFATSSGCL